MKRAKILIVISALGAVFLGWKFLGETDVSSGTQAGTALAEVTVPDLSDTARAGEAIFNDNCATCHGQDAAGVEGAGPPLVHVIYEPNHHGDMAFQLAVRQGVRAHHWRFGNMPAVPGLEEQDVTRIVTYIRELQRANGIR